MSVCPYMSARSGMSCTCSSVRLPYLSVCPSVRLSKALYALIWSHLLLKIPTVFLRSSLERELDQAIWGHASIIDQSVVKNNVKVHAYTDFNFTQSEFQFLFLLFSKNFLCTYVRTYEYSTRPAPYGGSHRFPSL